MRARTQASESRGATRRTVLRAGAATAAAGLLVSACGPFGRAGPAGGTAAATLPPATLSFLSQAAGGSPFGQAVPDMLRRFEQRHPGVRVELEFGTGPDFAAKVLSRMVSGAAPDVFHSQSIFMMSYLKAKGPLGLNALVRRSGMKPREEYFPQIVDLFTVEGQLWGLPREYNCMALAYNLDQFARVGLPDPSELARAGRWTWDALLDSARRLSAGEGENRQWGALAEQLWWHLMMWMWQNGAGIYDQGLQPRRTTVEQPTAAEALQWWADMGLRHRVAPRPDEWLQPNPMHMFYTGRVGMAPLGSNNRGDANRGQGLRYDIAPLPWQKRRATFIGGSIQCITAATRYPENAWELLRVLAGGEGMALLADIGVRPALKEIAYAPQWLTPLGPPQHVRVWMDEVQHGQGLYRVVNGQGLIEALNQLSTPIWSGERAAVQRCKELAPVFEALRQER